MTADRMGRRAAAAVLHDARTMPLIDIARVARRRRATTALAGTLLLILILGAGTLAATALTGGTEPDVAAMVGEVATCPPGSNPDLPGPSDQARPEPDDWAIGAVDTESGVLVTLIWGSTPGADQAETWTFDLCTNTWRQMSPATSPPGDVARHLVYDAESDLVVAFGRGADRPWTYDVDADVWTAGSSPPGPVQPDVAAYEPAADLVILIGDGNTWSYDPDTGVWASRTYVLLPDSHSRFAVYDPVIGGILVWTYVSTPGDYRTFTRGVYGTFTHRYDAIEDSWTLIHEGPYQVGVGYGVWDGWMAHDERSGLTVILGHHEIAIFDGRIPAWEYDGRHPVGSPADPIGPLDRWGHAVAADPINDRIVVFGGERFVHYEGVAEGSAHDLWAYDPSTGKWTMLLADITD